MTSLTLLGRLTSDPEKKSDKVAVARMACNQRGDDTVYINIKSMKESMSSFMMSYLKKGDEIFVIATLQDDSFKNSSGEIVNKNILYARVERIDFIPSVKKVTTSEQTQTSSEDCPF